ncbi:MAG TPA: hypothetical protein VMW65_13320, partial [Chloroflexota bacterium]|nr:hypothetical protein [Chloroflexota bacterium]
MLMTSLRVLLPRISRRSLAAFAIGLIVIGAVGASPPATSAEPNAAGQEAPITAQDVPVTLVSTGVSDFTTVQPTTQHKLVWHTAAYCPPIITGPQSAGKNPAAPIGPAAASDPEILTTGSTFGGFVRQILNKNDTRPPGTCNPYHFRSNLVADASYVYWVDDTGLERLSVDANVGDAPQLAYNFVANGWDPTTQNFYLGEDASNVYVLAYGADQGGPYENIGYVAKTTASNPAQDYNVLYFVGTGASNVSSDGIYLYWLDGSTLWRHTLGTTNSAIQLATNVTAYYPEGSVFGGCIGIRCFFTNNVYIAQGTSISVYNNDNSGAGVTLLYTTADPVYALTSDDSYLYFFESHTIPCGQLCFPSYNDVLYRGPRSNSGAVSAIYTYSAGLSPYGAGPLVTDDTYLYWEQNSG